MSFFWEPLKKMAFQVDAEKIHDAFCSAIQHCPNFLLKTASNACLHSQEKIKVADISFSGRVGLAAGFDKNAKLLLKLPSLGFHFAEIGTVTPRPQPGNEKPRLYRLPNQNALFNRYGFNSDGAEKVANRIENARKYLDGNFRVGINIGKNKDTPIELSHLDYAKSAEILAPLADYLVLNISSPNTPGLRSLQSLDSLERIMESVRNAILHRNKKTPPLFLKLAPELSDQDWKQWLIPYSLKNDSGISGWILTNTLAHTLNHEIGGLSGSPLTETSRNRLQQVRALSKLPIISVGGIMTPEEAKTRFNSGADLIQIYTGWIYQGPRLPGQICRLAHA